MSSWATTATACSTNRAPRSPPHAPMRLLPVTRDAVACCSCARTSGIVCSARLRRCQRTRQYGFQAAEQYAAVMTLVVGMCCGVRWTAHSNRAHAWHDEAGEGGGLPLCLRGNRHGSHAILIFFQTHAGSAVVCDVCSNVFIRQRMGKRWKRGGRGRLRITRPRVIAPMLFWRWDLPAGRRGGT